ncbi:unnamed protein product [Neospora caninum Liverpool]|uniref:Toxoplasma gondii family A protein n=1 Tax=Neospora caninum (strain Liverpool) TaxID=572307 RepID=F0VRI5_NEOCL|nr:uncharacterized protein NCLIV_067580 [Neospora caninum Liverpool]CBZ56333.1 unnamed protein product [Neospora caninum Liverpool]CEL71093.1 TPA: Toxoplasma gondii family A protein [Neospora caninum Liverpool]|eukprot:XP_003886358.1 uncharacterized protein NCLIV_067580 [Neospora caninum Liverpool]
MERQLFRAVCLTLLVGAVLSCVASETSEQKTEVDFTATIPKGGLERDLEQVFSLGPSGKLQVVDETGDAVYLPQPSEGADEQSSDSYSAAYLFENGVCDFTKKVVFKEAFPGYTKPLWVSDETPSGESEKASTGGIVKYTFTNPPAEYVGGRVSFCVRFRTVLANSSQSTPTPPGNTLPESSDEEGPHSSAQSGEPSGGATGEGNQGPQERPHSEKPGDSGSDLNGQPPPQAEAEGTEQNGGEAAKQDKDEALSEPLPDGSTVGSPAAVPPNKNNVEKTEDPSKSPTLLGDEAKAADVPQPLSQQTGASSQPVEASRAADSEVTADGSARNTLGHNVDGSVSVKDGARLRRLSGTPAEQHAFLTLVVHSEASGISSGIRILSVVLLTLTATLVSSAFNCG